MVFQNCGSKVLATFRGREIRDKLRERYNSPCFRKCDAYYASKVIYKKDKCDRRGEYDGHNNDTPKR